MEKGVRGLIGWFYWESGQKSVKGKETAVSNNPLWGRLSVRDQNVVDKLLNWSEGQMTSEHFPEGAGSHMGHVDVYLS